MNAATVKPRVPLVVSAGFVMVDRIAYPHIENECGSRRSVLFRDEGL